MWRSLRHHGPAWVLIRAIFDKGAADAFAKLEKHSPQDIVVRAGLAITTAAQTLCSMSIAPANVDPMAETVVWVHGGFVSGRRGDLANT